MAEQFWKTRARTALQGKLRSLMEPLYAEQASLRAESMRASDAARAQAALAERTARELAVSMLFSRWLTSPNTLASRNEVGHWLNWLGLNGTGVEVGVFQGEFSQLLLQTWECSRLTSVDPWRQFPSEDYVDTCNFSQKQHDLNYSSTAVRLAPFGIRSQILRATSVEASPQFESRSLDFVYLDAQHHYEAVRDDIALWHSRVRSGGVIGGHDYLDGRLPSGLYGVKRAVDEFTTAHGYQVVVTREPNWPSWFARVA